MIRPPSEQNDDPADTLDRLAATQPNLPVPLTATERADLREAARELRQARWLLRRGPDILRDCVTAATGMVSAATRDSPELPEEAAGWWHVEQLIRRWDADIQSALRARRGGAR